MSTLLQLRHKFIEGFALFLHCYLGGMIETTITNFVTPQAPAYAGVTRIFPLDFVHHGICTWLRRSVSVVWVS